MKELQNYELQQKEIATLVQASIIPVGTPPEQIKVFARFCKEKGLSPFSGEVHLVSYNTRDGAKFSRIVGIEGQRKIAARTGQYAGADDAKFDLESNGNYKTAVELQREKQIPMTATVTVYRIIAGQRVAYTATAIWGEYAQVGKRKDGTTYWMGKWNPNGGMPFHMLAKCAEVLALRKGFADELSGMYAPEEQGAWEDAPRYDSPEPTSDEDEKETLALIEHELSQIHTVEELAMYFKRNPQWRADANIIELFADRKNEIEYAAGN